MHSRMWSHAPLPLPPVALGALVGGLLPRAARGRWPRAGGARTLRAAPTIGSALPFLSLTAVLDSRPWYVKGAAQVCLAGREYFLPSQHFHFYGRMGLSVHQFLPTPAPLPASI